MIRFVTSRTRSKTLLLTYPHCGLGLEDMKQRLIRILEEHHKEVEYGCICAELHNDRLPHRHVFLRLDSIINIGKNKMNMFDLEKDDQGAWDVNESHKYHCNIQHVNSPKEAIRYVKKSGEYIEWGICPYADALSMAEKNKLLQEKKLNELVEEGIISIFKISQLDKARQILQNELQHKSTERVKIYWFWGPTGTGKSFKAREEAYKDRPENIEEEDWCWVCPVAGQRGTIWFDGYHGQPTVIFDDLRSNTISFNALLQITDVYQDFKVPIKGGFVKWIPRRIYITSPGQPRDIYCRHGENGEKLAEYDGIDQLERRITEMKEFK